MDHWQEINLKIERLKQERFFLMRESERLRDAARTGDYKERTHTLRAAQARDNKVARISILIRELAQHARQTSERYY